MNTVSGIEKILILTVGLPQSGKSTWARSQNFPIVNPDSIRMSLHGYAYIEKAEPYVWLIARTMVESLFLAGHEKVILDATNVTRERRNLWKEFSVRYKTLDTGADECISRANENGKSYLIPIIRKMQQSFEPLHENDIRFQ